MAVCFRECGRVIRSSRLNHGLWNYKPSRLNDVAFQPAAVDLRCSAVIITSRLHTLQKKKPEMMLNEHMPRQNLLTQNIFTSSVLFKKFREELYEKLRIFDPSGNFLCIAELLILEKFRKSYHRYTFVEMDSNGNTTKANKLSEAGTQERSSDESSLKSFQILLKETKHKPTGENQITEIKIRKGELKNSPDPWKYHKIKQALLDKGAVNVTLLGDEMHTRTAVRAIRDSISDFCTITEKSVVTEKYTNITLSATVTTLETKVFRDLIEEIQAKEAPHLKMVQEMMDVQKQ